MVSKNYYEILEISVEATQDEIRKSYRKLAIKYHPDKNQDDPTAEEKFKEVNEAYSTLSDDDKREVYDSKIKLPKSSSFTAPKKEPKKVNPIDLRTRGPDIRVIASLTKLELSKSKRKEVLTVKYEQCQHCNGSGRDKTSEVDVCLNCLGTGVEENRTYTSAGSFVSRITCHECKGLRTTNLEECSFCEGSGYIKIQSSVVIEIPENSKTGDLITITGLGEPSPNGGEPGNLIIKLFIR